MSLPRAFQWLGVAAGLFVLVGLNYDFKSDAGETINAPVEDSLSQSLLGYWKMDEGTGTSTTADSSGNANNLTMTAMEEGDWVAGQIGAYSLDFDGSAEWLTVSDPSSGVLDIVDGADFSIVGWFNRDTFAADHTIVAKRNSQATNTDAGYIVWVDNNGSTDYLNFTVGDGGGTANDQYTVAGATDLSATGWHHFAVTWDDGVGMYLYLDGKQDGSTTSSTSNIGSLANAVAFRIGAESDNGNPFDGKIDDVKLYSHALSANEVSRLYQTTVPGSPVDTGLVGHWTFDGNDVNWGDTTSEIKDVSGKGNHGDAAGSLATTSVRIGKLGQGLSFNGTSDYIDAGSASSLDDIQLQGGGGLTASFWVYPRTLSIVSNVLQKARGGTPNWHIFSSSIDNGIYFEVSDSGLYVSTLSKKIIDNSWNHIVVTWDGSQNASGVHIYLNGGEGTYENYENGSTHGSDASGSLGIGATEWAENVINGNLDDVRLYNRVLSVTEVANLYNVGR